MVGWWFFTRDRRPLVDLLCMLYGLSSWLAITGLWMELPLLVHALPESWALSASLSLAIQLGNVGPLLYGLGRFLWTRAFTGPRALSVANHVQLCIGLAACVVLICAWKVTAFVLHRETSLVLLFAAFALSIVDCTSSVVYLPFVGRFREVYMTSYLVGEGLGGIVPSLVALAQGLNEPECVNETVTHRNKGVNDSADSEERLVTVLHVGATNFDPEVFFGVLLLLVVLSYGAFVLLDNCRSFETEWQDDFRQQVTRHHEVLSAAPDAMHLNPLPAVKEEDTRKQCPQATLSHNNGEVCFKSTNAKPRHYVVLLAIQTWASLLTFGFLPAIQGTSKAVVGTGEHDTPSMVMEPVERPLGSGDDGINFKLPSLGALHEKVMNSPLLTPSTFRPTIDILHNEMAKYPTRSFDSKVTNLLLDKHPQLKDVIGSRQSYSCLPYGPRALHLSVTLCGVAYPVACALAMFVALRRLRHIWAQMLLGTLAACYIALTAATSPSPPLVDTDVGAFLVVSCWVCTFLLLSYAKTMVTLLLTSHGENALFWVGACTQAGALVGSLVPYVLVNVSVFVERDHCALST